MVIVTGVMLVAKILDFLLGNVTNLLLMFSQYR